MLSDFLNEKTQSDDINDYDIIIIGAGVTGLVTAYFLIKKDLGLNVLILEADKTVGGRVFSAEGSEVFHAHPLQESITELLCELDIETVQKREIEVSNIIFLTERGPLYELPSYIGVEVYNFLLSIHRLSKRFELRNHVSHEDATKLARMSLHELITKMIFPGTTANSICESLLYSSCGIDSLQKVSALWYLMMIHGAGGFLQRLKVTLGDGSRYFIKGGMTQLVNELLRRIKSNRGSIRCLEAVSRVQFNGTRVYVTTHEKCYRCDYVVIAVPPPESNRLIIEPSLSYISSEAQNLFINATNSFFTVKLERKCWSHDNKFFRNILATADSDSNLRLAYDAAHYDNETRLVLAGFLTESNYTSCKKFKLFESLNRSSLKNTQTNYIFYKEQKWMPFKTIDETDDVITGGSPMSFLKPCDWRFHINPLISHHERFFFAASEYATNWPGTVDGAIETGKIVATLILSRSRPQALNGVDLSYFPYVLE